jgi:branched-chain amino acid transport system permease protein
MFSLDLLIGAVVFGVLVGSFYAAISIGLSIAFGLLDVPHIAHAAFLVLGAYFTYMLSSHGWDPLLAGLAIAPLFFLFGVLVYRIYHRTFEKRASDAGVRGIAFFFGIAFLIQVGLNLAFGLDQRMVEARYIGASLELDSLAIPWRLLVAFAVALGLAISLMTYLAKTFQGRAIRAVAQDAGALQMVGADPVRIKRLTFGLATAVTGIAGALLIIVAPVDPSLDRAYIGRTFCVVVLAGLGSVGGTLIAGLILGIAESIVLTLFGASWAPAVSFGLLLLVLGVRPQGVFGR